MMKTKLILLAACLTLPFTANALVCKRDGGVAYATHTMPNGNSIFVQIYRDSGRCIEKGETSSQGAFAKTVWYDGGRRNVRGQGDQSAGEVLEMCGFGRC